MALTSKDKFGRIGVLMGGPSTEREVSLKSGKAVVSALTDAGLETVPIDIKTDDNDRDIKLIRSKKINCAFIALHGRFGEDGQVQSILEQLKIPYTGSGVLASQLAMDKIASRRIFENHGLKVPAYQVVNNNANWSINAGFNMPLVVKPASHGSSIGLSIIDKEEDLDKAVNFAFSFDKNVIVEEYIKGRELTVGVLDEKVMPIVEIIPKRTFFDYEAKYQSGLTEYIVPAKLPVKIAAIVQKAGLAAHQLLGCFGCSRVDIILNEENIPVVLEVNTIPGLTSTSLLPKAAKCIGMEFGALCMKLIKLAYEKKKN